MAKGQKVRVVFFSIAAGGVTYGSDIGTVESMIGLDVFVNFSGKIQKIKVYNLALL